MKTCLSFVLLYCVSALSCAMAEEQTPEKLKQAMQQKVSFEFVDTPLVDVVQFLGTLTHVNLMVDPVVLAKNPPVVNLRVTDMNLDTALQWIMKLAELESVVRDNAIFISTPQRIKEMALGDDPKNKKLADNMDGVLRVRFASGDMLEVDVQMIRKFPGIAQELMSLAFDPAMDEMLVLAPGRDIPPQIPMEVFVQSIKQAAPKAELKFDENLKLLMITSADEGDLRKINAIARSLRKAGMPGFNNFVEVKDKAEKMLVHMGGGGNPKIDKQMLIEERDKMMRLKADLEGKAVEMQKNVKGVKPPKPPDTAVEQF